MGSFTSTPSEADPAETAPPVSGQPASHSPPGEAIHHEIIATSPATTGARPAQGPGGTQQGETTINVAQPRGLNAEVTLGTRSGRHVESTINDARARG